VTAARVPSNDPVPRTLPSDSVGLVEVERATFDTPIVLNCGTSLNHYEIVYETYGTLNERASNAILICHALSGDHHAAGFHSLDDKKPGWWDNAIGPGKPLDTNHFFIVAPNNLGGCSGSTGPASINPDSGQRYGPDFPIVTVKDWVESQARLADRLGIEQWAAVVGGSLGGMQAMQWAIDFPSRIRHSIVIAAAPKLSTQNIAFNEVARQAIRADSDFHEGRYYDHGVTPERGLALARMLGHITYLSDDILNAKFGRERRTDTKRFGYDVEFQIESYLRHQGQSFVSRFDANSYLLMTKTLDYFDPAIEYGDDLTMAMRQTLADFLVISFSSDWRFAPSRSREIVRSLIESDRPVTYAEIESEQGHDSFLLPIRQYHRVLGNYLGKVRAELEDARR